MLNERIKKALEEIKFGDQFDIQLVNGNLSDAKLKAEDLIKKFIES
jgi:guanylate kinase